MFTMKIKTPQIKYIIITFLLIMVPGSVICSQEIDTIPVYKPRTYMGINFGYGKTTIINKGIQSVSDLNTSGDNSFSVSFDFGYSFSRSFGLSTGLGFSSYSTKVSPDTYSNKFNTTDSENELYERRIEGSDIIELQDVSFLSLPLALNFTLPVGKKGGFFLQTGIYFSLPVIKNYSSSGTFTYTGFYPAYNVLLQDLPEYGFVSNAAVATDGTPDLKPITIQGGGGAGFKYLFGKSIEVLVGVNYIRSLSGFVNYPSPEEFQLSSDENQMNSIMGGCSKVATQSLGFNLSLRYYLK